MYKLAFQRNFLYVCFLLSVLMTPVLLEAQGKPGAVAAVSGLENEFQRPPDSFRISVYWYWIGGNISKEGVVRDLEAMKRAGIGRAFIGNIGLDDIPSGRVVLFSPEWWEIVHAALKTATRLHIDIGFFNSPGWSQSGGPWIKPGHAMRYLVDTEVVVQGGRAMRVALKTSSDDFQPVKVIAFPRPKGWGDVVSFRKGSGIGDGGEYLFPKYAGTDTVIDLPTSASFTARSIVFLPGLRRMTMDGELQVRTAGGTYQKVCDWHMDRSNDAPNTGFEPYAPEAFSFPVCSGTDFRVVLHHWSEGCGLREIKLCADPAVAQYAGKTLAKMHPTPHPMWGTYLWPQEPEARDSRYVIDPARVLDISSYLDQQGVLHWQAPAGDWVIEQTGMRPTGVTNSQPPPGGKGLEVDKMSKSYIAAHFDAFLGEILRRIPAEDRQSFKVVVADSYETGSQNWTDGMVEKFKAIYGYDPVPYLPVMQGKVVRSEDASDRFLWDLRRLVADKVSYDYVGGLREVSHQHGLTTWLENYGHWGYPGEFLQYGGQSDEVAGEFWAEGDLGDIENRDASSCAHIYGKRQVSAESFTCFSGAYARYPAMLKARADRFFTEGINKSLLHVFISEADERKPGLNAWFGTEFNRRNSWWEDMDLFTAYLKRCNIMLQQGRYVADVAYFIGEDAPKMTGDQHPALPKGYSFDYINAEVLEHRVSIKSGRWTLPDGLSYKVLVLPPQATMRPQLLAKLRDLVQAGGVLLGPAPDRSPSLSDYSHADTDVRKMAAEMWGNIDGHTVTTHAYGNGRVIDGDSLAAVLQSFDVAPDLTVDKDGILFIHRRLADKEVYFISNQSNSPVRAECSFRVSGKAPELWDAVTGERRMAQGYRLEAGRMILPLSLAGTGSVFVVFRDERGGTAVKDGEVVAIDSINRSWSVQFDTSYRGPAKPVVFPELVDWTTRSEDSIRNYSGKAVYATSFTMQTVKAGEPVYLDLGMVKDMAKIWVNGVYVGGVWTAPYRVNITQALKRGENTLRIEVINTWVNRLIGDSKLPPEARQTWSNYNKYTPDSPYQSSGLLGPVRIYRLQ